MKPCLNGTRFLDTPLDQPGTPAEDWLSWDREFPLLDLTACPKLVLVSAHADDETYGLGATAFMLSPRVQVICASDTATQRRRRDELRCATRILTLPTPIFLGLPDGQLHRHVHHMAGQIALHLDPGDWVAAPWRGDGHPDHQAAGEAAMLAALEADACLLEYPVWMWHWAAPEDPAVPWQDAARIDTTETAMAHKRAAARVFLSQLTGPQPVLPQFVVDRWLTVGELVFT